MRHHHDTDHGLSSRMGVSSSTSAKSTEMPNFYVKFEQMLTTKAKQLHRYTVPIDWLLLLITEMLPKVTVSVDG